MVKKLLYSFLLLLLFLVNANSAWAITDPLAVPNNKFGIHISNEYELDDAYNLVNSSGGDWGYVTFVITEGERDKDRWQRVFNDMRKRHLIPIVRIATKSNSNGVWDKPKSEEVNNWTAFLNSLTWVTKNRYVVIYNEPNHAKEWGGTVNPQEYATIFREFSLKLKGVNEDFFVLTAGLDASAPNSSSTMDEEEFIKKMLEVDSGIFNYADGLASHAYPNPDFSGSELATGRGTVTTYNWELNLLKGLGVTKNLPIFITETGWKHNMEKEKSPYVSPGEAARRLTYAYEEVWSEPNIVAITPFILNYKEAPFANFSWTKEDGTFYDFYEAVRKIKKEHGKPEQKEAGTVLAVFTSPIHRGGSIFGGTILVKNHGESIWNYGDISVREINAKITILESTLHGPVEPQKYSVMSFKAVAPINNGLYGTRFALYNKDKKITNDFPFEILSIGTNTVQSESFFDKIVKSFVNFLTNLGL